jgi:hypothetical protein
VHHFSAGGADRGLMLLIDDESQTYWDHISGEAVHGPLKGHQLEVWGIEITTAHTALERYPDLLVYLSGLECRLGLYARLKRRLFRLLVRWGLRTPRVYQTLAPADNRLPAMTMGLGVVTKSVRRFYPLEVVGAGLEENLRGELLSVQVEDHGLPFAVWPDGSRPFQLFTRWYAFAVSFPNCTIFPGTLSVKLSPTAAPRWDARQKPSGPVATEPGDDYQI